MNQKIFISILINAIILAGALYLQLGPQRMWKKILSPAGDISFTWLFLNLAVLDAVLIFLITSVAINLKAVGSMFEPVEGRSGEVIQKATPTAIKKELADAAKDLAEKAENYFNAAEGDFASKNYQDASKNYQKSIDILPTSSAYGNLGLSLSFFSDYANAERAFFAGLKIARERRNRRYEAAFLGNIGNAYLEQEKLDVALKYYKRAVEVQEDSLDAIYQLGLTYLAKGSNAEALTQFESYLKFDPDSQRASQVQSFIDYLKKQ